MFKRMSDVEQGLAEMKGMLRDLLESKKGVTDWEAGSGSGDKGPVRGAKPKLKPTAKESPGKGLAGLDKGTVGAARAAGIRRWRG